MAQSTAALLAQTKGINKMASGTMASGTTAQVLLSAVRRDTRDIYALMLYWDVPRRIDLIVDWIGIYRAAHRVYVDLGDPLCSEAQRVTARNTLGKQLIAHAAKTIAGADSVLRGLYANLGDAGSAEWCKVAPATYLMCRAGACGISDWGNAPWTVMRDRAKFFPVNCETSSVGGWAGILKGSGFDTVPQPYPSRAAAFADTATLAEAAKSNRPPEWALDATARYAALWSQVGLDAAGFSPDGATGNGVSQPLGVVQPSLPTSTEVAKTVAASELLKSCNPTITFPDWANGLPYRNLSFVLVGSPSHPTFALLPKHGAGPSDNRRLSSIGQQFGASKWSVSCVTEQTGIVKGADYVQRSYLAWQPLEPAAVLAPYRTSGSPKIHNGVGCTHWTYELRADRVLATSEASAIIRAWAHGFKKLKGQRVRLDALGYPGEMPLLDIGVINDSPNRMAAYATFDATTQEQARQKAQAMAALASGEGMDQSIEQLKTVKRGRRIKLID